MLNKMAAFIRQQDMIAPGDCVICAVSGGADSVALLFGLYLLREKLNITLEAAHFNHQLRGEESDRDARFVQALCARYDIPLHIGQAQVVAGKKGLEAAAREARYAFFKTLTGKIATAHTADDNAETLLMHLIRGTGLKGLGGITPVHGRIIRPMLSVTRADVESFLNEYYVNYIEDSSNNTDMFLRNRLRHHVLPLLKAENPRFAENLSQLALRLRLDEEFLACQAQQAGGATVSQLRQMHPAVRSRVLETFLRENGVHEPEQTHIAMVENLVFSKKPSAKACLPGGVTVCRSYDCLAVPDKSGVLEERELPCPGQINLPGFRVRCVPAQKILNTPDTFTVTVSGKVYIRCRRSGDTITLPGGTKSLKKMFIDRKIPAAQRMQIPVLADDAGVLGVYGIGVNRNRIAADLPAVTIMIEKDGG